MRKVSAVIAQVSNSEGFLSNDPQEREKVQEKEE
jgi:hypothetical protein